MGSLLGDLGRALSRRTFRNAARVPLVAPGTAGLVTLFGQTDRCLDVMGASGVVYAIVNGLAEATAGVEWHLYRSAVSGKPEDRTLIPNDRHQASRVWTRPNNFTTRTTFVHQAQQHLELVGETEWMVAYGPGTSIPIELWPIRPDRMTPDPHPTEFMVGWHYTPPGQPPVPLGLDEVLQTKIPDPSDPYRGLGVVQALLADIGAASSAAEWTRNFFSNNARPGGVVEIPTQLSDPQFRQLVDRWNYAHRGVRNANRVAFLEGGAKYIGGQFSQRDMQFTEMMGFTDEKIRAAFRFPTPMLGTVTDVNRANADAAELMLARWLILPRLRRLRDTLNTSFLPLFGSTAVGVEFDFVNPVADDRETDLRELDVQTAAYEKLVRAGVDRDDAARVVGLPVMRQAPVQPQPTALPTVAKGAPGPEQRPTARSRIRVTGQGDPRESDPTYRAFDQVMTDTLGTWSADITPAVITALVDLIADALNADDPGAALAGVRAESLGDVTGQARDLITDALIRMHAESAALAAAEAADAGFEVEPAGPSVATGVAMATLPTAIATVLLSAATISAVSEAVRLLTAGAVGIPEQVGVYLGALTDAYPAQKIGGAVWGAATAGRLDTAEASGLKVVYVADERLDRNTCKPCRDVNGAVYYSVTAMRADGYAFGGYTDCLGRERCRGFARVAWNGEVE